MAEPNENDAKHSSDILDLAKEAKISGNIGKAIETIFSNETDSNIIKDKITLLLKEYLKSKHPSKSKKEIAKQNILMKQGLHKLIEKLDKNNI